MALKVLQINTERTWRGGERQTLYTAEGLRDAGVEADLLCSAGSPLAQRAADAGIEVLLARTNASGLKLLATRGRSYDLLHAQTAKGQSLAVLSRACHRRPVIYTRRVNFVPRGPLAVLKYRMTDRLVANNRAAGEILKRIGARRVDVIPSAVRERELDRERAAHLGRRLGLEGRRVVGVVGDLVPQKDPLTMIRTMARVISSREDVVGLQFGGAQMRRVVEGAIAEHGLGRRFHLMGHHDAVEDYFALFDVYLACAREGEGFVSSVLDAFVYGVPVVATRIGGLLDSVGDRGALCAPGDAQDHADAVLKLLDDTPLRRKRIAKAQSEARNLFAVPVIARRYVSLYEELLAGSAVSPRRRRPTH